MNYEFTIEDIERSHQRRRARIDAAFWSKVDQSGGPDACWPWAGVRQTPKSSGVGGYGYFVRRGRTVYAHRRALELKLGRPLGDQEHSLHRCDNPPCCNPDHLFLGTNADNIRDSHAKRRRERLRSWSCPDCSATVTRMAMRAGGRCDDCAAQATKAKRRRQYVTWRLRTPLKDQDWRKRRREVCVNGHAMTPDNVTWVGATSRRRNCLTCLRARESAQFRKAVGA